jgi:hypothetical protein
MNTMYEYNMNRMTRDRRVGEARKGSAVGCVRDRRAGRAPYGCGWREKITHTDLNRRQNKREKRQKGVEGGREDMLNRASSQCAT